MSMKQRLMSRILIRVYSERMAIRPAMLAAGMLARGACLGAGTLIQ